MIYRRTAGVLMHITSLPSAFGTGDLGPGARQFADFLADAHLRLWQVLPPVATTAAADHSPYATTSASAGNPLLISPETLRDEGLLDDADLADAPGEPGRVDFAAVEPWKRNLLGKACERFRSRGEDPEFARFCRTHADWLDDFAMFIAISEHLGQQSWADWPAELRDRNPDALRQICEQLAGPISDVKIQQYFFHRQWTDLRGYCRGRGISLMGDMPLYVVHNSADVWARPQYFQLDDAKGPTAVAGFPPDNLAPQGQVWNMPLFDWKKLQEDGFSWWLGRVGRQLEMVDWLRIDHFLGLCRHWSIPAGAADATAGHWEPTPGEDLLAALAGQFSELPLIAEDLPEPTPEAQLLKERFDLPGMYVMVDAWTSPSAKHPFAPHNHAIQSMAYTSTHDHATTRGWFEGRGAGEEAQRMAAYVGHAINPDEVHWEMIRVAMASVARAAVTTTQDILGLGAEARMNQPGTGSGNWRWRLEPGRLTPEIAARLADMSKRYGRA